MTNYDASQRDTLFNIAHIPKIVFGTGMPLRPVTPRKLSSLDPQRTPDGLRQTSATLVAFEKNFRLQ
jgi:hypothetical protein